MKLNLSTDRRAEHEAAVSWPALVLILTLLGIPFGAGVLLTKNWSAPAVSVQVQLPVPNPEQPDAPVPLKMVQPRWNASATFLDDGRILIYGGYKTSPPYSGDSVPADKVEAFDPVTLLFREATAQEAALVDSTGPSPVDLSTTSIVLSSGFPFEFGWGGVFMNGRSLDSNWDPNVGALKRDSALAVQLTGSLTVTNAQYQLVTFGLTNRLLVVGGLDSNGAVLDGALVSPARIETDLSDYSPGQDVILSGSGWKPGEWVDIYVVDNSVTAPEWIFDRAIQADANGNFDTIPFLFEVLIQHLGVTFDLSAVGSQSGLLAEVKFTDAPKNRAYVQVTACSPGVLHGNFSITYTSKNNNTVTGTFSTPHTFQVTPGSQFTINSVQDPVNGISYKGSTLLGTLPPFSQTAGAKNTTTVLALNYCSGDVAPTITCPGNQTLSACDPTADYSGLIVVTGIPGPSVTCTIGGSTVTWPHTFPIVPSLPTTTTVICTAVNTQGTASCQFNVIVNSGTGPHIVNCPVGGNLPVDANCQALVPDFTGLEPIADYTICNGNGTVTQLVSKGATTYNINDPVGPGTYTVVVTVTDSSNLSDSCSTTFTVVDDTPPTITCPVIGNKDVNTDLNQCTAVVGGLDPTYADSCPGSSLAYVLSGDTTDSGSGSATGKTFNKGVTTVTYTVTDATGLNTATCNFTVTVHDAQNPTITCPVAGNKDVNTDLNQCTAVVGGLDPTYADSCPGASLAYVLSGDTTDSGSGSASGKTFNKGVTTVAYTVTDATGLNTATCNFTVTVHDAQNPTITCPVVGNKDVNTDLNQCTAVVGGLDPTYADNCPGSSLAYVLSGDTTDSGSGSATGKTFNKGVTTVTYTVTDATGLNTATCNFTVTVHDAQNPTITCPVVGNKDVNTDLNQCTAVVGGLDPTYADSCPGSSLAYVLSGDTTDSGSGSASGKTFNKGVTTVTYTVTDATGLNTATCNFTVTVHDAQNPTITCPVVGNKDVDTDLNQCTAVVGGLDPTYADSCPGASLAYVLSGDTTDSGSGSVSGKTFNKGVTTVTYTVTDATGQNTATCNFTVTVHDAQNPTITCPVVGNKDVNTDLNQCTAVVGGLDPTYADSCPGSSLAYVLSGDTTGSGSGSATGQAFNKGVTTVTYTVTDATGLNTATCNFTVTVHDAQNPTITCPVVGNKDVNTDLNQCTAVVGGLDPTYADSCPGSSLAYVLSGDTTDSGSGSVSGKTFNKGVTTVTYTVTDATGLNTATCNFTVTVHDAQNPTITCPVVGNKDVDTDLNQCTAVVGGLDPTYADSCPGASLAYVLSGDTTDSGSGSVSGKTFNKGVTTVTYTVTDATGQNTATCNFTVTVHDAQNPTITCPVVGNKDVNTDLNQCTAVVGGLDPTYADSCPGSSLAYVLSGDTTDSGSGSVSGKTFNKGVTTVTYTVTDATGLNTATCNFTVTVHDAQNPTITCPVAGNKDVNTNPNNCTAVVGGLDPIYADNCPGSNLSYVLSGVTTGTGSGSATGKMFNKGVTTVTYTVTDATGLNTATCNFTVTVHDAQNPTITCPVVGNKDVNTDLNNCTAVVGGLNPTYADNCPGSNLNYVLSGVTTDSGSGSATGKTFNTGVTTVTYTVTDATGLNTATCSFTVTVNPRSTTLTYTGVLSGRFGECVAVSATLKDTLTGLPIASKPVTITISGNPTVPSATLTTDSQGNVNGIVQLTTAPGTLPQNVPVIAAFAGDCAYASNADTKTFDYQPQLVTPPIGASAVYTGSEVFWTTSPTSSTASLALSATVADTTADCSPNITKSRVTFYISTSGAAGSFSPITGASNLPVGVVTPGNLRVGTASATVQYNIGNHINVTLFIAVGVNGDYLLPAIEVHPISIAKPVTGQITGTGTLDNSGAAGKLPGLVAGVGSSKTAVGVSYNKSGSNPQGSISTTVYTTDDHTKYFILKSNAISTFSVKGSTATFSAKCNITDQNGVSIDGGALMQVTLTDNGTSGDTMAVSVQNSKSGGLWFGSQWDSTQGKVIQKPLSGGSLAVQ